jgi:hypothetical protein
MVSLKKLLYLDITMAGPSIEMYVVSKEIAAGTSAEMVILHGSPHNEDGTNYNRGSLCGDPDTEPLGRESNDDKESEALAQSSLESENGILLRRVKTLEEHN